MKLFTFTAAVLAASTATAAKLSQSQAEAKLKPNGITASSSGGCTNRQNKSCTSYDQINSATVDGVITLKKASGCSSLIITGGTEIGHASGTYSHYNGYKVDLRHQSCLDNYIKSAFTKIADRGDGYPQWKAKSGNIYCDEGSHWDVTYYTSG
ncbi:peptidoglycan-binding domain-containing protein [Pochonia chlamydosporia 170]|uniref:Peptidoglycan-binding domain-containing protein n=1 Tax=Pochonia chlamydosporia 170 TaxID=1380566 RepID=A0A179FZ10_METCM|nr:peptidoglycan-binding domain-containing protein [Pochonia chlamydosporia 170]OAQ70905.1 peptidoglycan-binding domain-containing protein [Pochonia chlamydosporia 170]